MAIGRNQAVIVSTTGVYSTARGCLLFGGLVSAFVSEGLAPACLEVSFSNYPRSRQEGGAVIRWADTRVMDSYCRTVQS